MTGEMVGSDATCNTVLGDLRQTEARYRANPGLREREAEHRRRTLEQLTAARRALRSQSPQ